jgi:Arc/MetJ-type ribon-helix-helix transcriptional regulator
MTERTTLVQARLTEEGARQVDHDIATLGLRNRSEAVREGLRLLHRQASHVALAREYDEFYGGGEAPVSDITAMGAEVAAATMLDDAER